MTLIIISGEIDLSWTPSSAWPSALLGVLWKTGGRCRPPSSVVALTGLAAAPVDGLFVTRLRLPSPRGDEFRRAGPGTGGIATYSLGRQRAKLPPPTPTSASTRSLAGRTHHLLDSHSRRARDHLRRAAARHSVGRSIYAMGASARPRSFSGIRVERVDDPVHAPGLRLLAGRVLSRSGSTRVRTDGLGLNRECVVAIVCWPG